ncbi:TTL-domain-containing protein [Pluteus cervinus]|uniref:TTL-domain-containing protein n=1 Tax=Pluteus cervinus TaxID=181527 RepID=A0ACD3BH04_9AGAR|nr:TTL-domain-containing protein [Pluteus cervinus]
MTASSLQVFVEWPHAPLTKSLVIAALKSLDIPFTVLDKLSERSENKPLLQWATYDAIDHEITFKERELALSSCYTFRKALIRKHFLSRTVHSYTTKRPLSILKSAIPRTFELELTFADELDEMWTDELWELAAVLDEGNSWWILKPGMADRGMGIRLFNSKDGLTTIMEGFEPEDDDGSEKDGASTSVPTSQLRHFVIQEYIPDPLLMNPTDILSDGPEAKAGFKFHLRAYVVASGIIQVYLYNRVLALFSSTPYSRPTVETVDDLSPHLTNTSFQPHHGEENVRLLEELVGCPVRSREGRLTQSDVDHILDQVSNILAEAFQAALQLPVHFQPVHNGFELYGVDFLVEHPIQDQGIPGKTYQVKLLEFNAEPAIEMTGPRLRWVLEDLFAGIGKVCVEPFFGVKKGEWAVGEVKHNFTKCLETQVGAYH